MRTPDGAVWIPDDAPPARGIFGYLPQLVWRDHVRSTQAQVRALTRYVDTLSAELRLAAPQLDDRQRGRILHLIGESTTNDQST